jgi:hypothetical protein
METIGHMGLVTLGIIPGGDLTSISNHNTLGICIVSSSTDDRVLSSFSVNPYEM